MEIIQTPEAMTAWSMRAAAAGSRIGLVPTMGYFHAGHLSLMRLARQQADCTVVSLFVNPLQFGPREDLARYPRDLARDSGLAGQQGVDVLFVPDQAEMYSEHFMTRVSLAALSDKLCGRFRPGHFDGVATVVAKLFNVVRPECAVFGEKDWQQLAIIRRLTTELNWPIRIIGHPIVREPDGLAMSSRNIYLSAAQRKSALCLHQALLAARKMVDKGLVESKMLRAEVERIIRGYPETRIEYISIVDPDDLTDLEQVEPAALLAMAVFVGSTRLIDNGRLC